MIDSLDAPGIEKVLNGQIFGRIGCHADGVTYVVPISYAYDGRYVYAHSREGMKISMMRQNPDVCFEVDTMQDMANWQSVIAWGKFEELKDRHTRDRALEFLVSRVLPIVSSETTHLSKTWPFPSIDLNEIDGVVFRIELSRKTGRFETNAAVPAYVS